ncbi:MAG TPA: [FeFe] hydrogenase H-cluster radical SAM maturase HydE [Spirochaetia bacterium]|nr:[FeFe] hydrogenase H-cluster radical SAM maturase HydE [Spirochaetia bacterium]
MNREKLEYYINNTEQLKAEANAICRKHYGNKVFLRGLIEFSNMCQMDCLYCGIRKSNSSVHRYKLDIDTIVAVVKKGYESGLKTFVLQSGESDEYSITELCTLSETIKNITNGEVAITLSCGIKSKEKFKELKKAGADRYLLRFETSDPQLHTYLRNGTTLEKRLRALHDLKETGFEVGSGFMTGLPGETEKIFLDNIELCEKMQFDMVGIGPFIPDDNTPLAHSIVPDLHKTLLAVGLIRLTLPLSNIPATTAAGSVDNTGREQMLEWGANVLMPNITPVEYKKDYLLYPGKICLDESGFECIGCLAGRVATVNKELY